MPMYDFKCKECGELTTVILSMDNCDDAPPCEHCGGETGKFIGATFKTTVSGVRKGNYNSGDLS